MILTIEKLIEQLEINKKAAVEGLRNCWDMEIGQVARQGDVYFHRMIADWPRGEKLEIYQLAPGIGKGSRHCVDKSFEVYKGIRWPEYINENFRKIKECLGPVFVVKDKTLPVTHPEHCNFSFNKDVVIQVTYQANARIWKRTQD